MRESQSGSGFRLPVLEGSSTAQTGVTRRSFLQWLGSASIATLGAGCRPPKDRVAPYGETPPGMVPGNARHYATAMTLGGFASGLLVTSHEGRPTKIEGNPQHPMNLGSSGVWEQASLLQLYDPARARQILHRGEPVARATFVEAMQQLASRLEANGGARLRLLLEPSTSTVLASALERIRHRFPRSRIITWAPTASSAEAEGSTQAFGRVLVPRYRLSRAEVIVALDSDFLAIGPEALRLSREFADRRVASELPMNRLYAVEPSFTLTGSSADHRLPLPGSRVKALALALLDQVLVASGDRVDVPNPSDQQRFVHAMAQDLWAHRGASAVFAGERQPPEVHAAVFAINHLLGNVGSTIELNSPQLIAPISGPEELRELAAEIDAGAVQALVTDVFNPLYTLPADLNAAELFSRAPDSVYLGSYPDGTSKAVRWAVPSAHPLESWGDSRSQDGTVALTQPLIENLHESLQLEEVLSALVDPAMQSAHDQLRRLWAPRLGDAGWQSALQKGLVPNSMTQPIQARPDLHGVRQRAAGLESRGLGLELSVIPDYSVYDGRFARNPWLQELPDPITKVTWDNCLMISASTAARLGLRARQRVEVAVNGRRAHAAVNLVEGQAEDTATLTLGYGQPELQAEGEGPIGFDGYALRTSSAPWFMSDAKVSGLDSQYAFAITQGGDLSQQGRDLAITVDNLNPARGQTALREHREKQDSLYARAPYSGYQWALSIDLSRCTGCSACVVACVAENNIPTVGKENVANGREMQWIRVDRYLEGPGPSPEVVQQPTPCMHCENAPCEYVCPVNATVHSDEGLNEMVYNRCVGTRYCSNNCPYKVRRFNFLEYNLDLTPLQEMQKNPEVTVRGRGVMEKCTYCVQRIEGARIHAEEDGRPIADGEIKTACQQACPAKAIVFGTLSDPQSEVSQLRADPRRYDMLHELGTRPRTTYLAKLTNKNPELG